MPTVNCMRVLHGQLQGTRGRAANRGLGKSIHRAYVRPAQRHSQQRPSRGQVRSRYPVDAASCRCSRGQPRKGLRYLPQQERVECTRPDHDHWSELGQQVGGEAVDLVMVVTNDQGVQRSLSSQMKFGTEASVADGPVGLHAGTGSDATMKAEVLTYSRARGLFAGTNLNGASPSQDQDDTRALYGSDISFAQILSGKIPAPEASQPFLEVERSFAAQANNPVR
jgi:Las17-binding protein actin regulator